MRDALTGDRSACTSTNNATNRDRAWCVLVHRVGARTGGVTANGRKTLTFRRAGVTGAAVDKGSIFFVVLQMILGSWRAEFERLVLGRTISFRPLVVADLDLRLALGFAIAGLGLDDGRAGDECGDAAEDTANDAASGR